MPCCGKARRKFQNEINKAKQPVSPAVPKAIQTSQKPQIPLTRAERIKLRQEKIRRRAERIAQRKARIAARALLKVSQNI